MSCNVNVIETKRYNIRNFFISVRVIKLTQLNEGMAY